MRSGWNLRQRLRRGGGFGCESGQRGAEGCQGWVAVGAEGVRVGGCGKATKSASSGAGGGVGFKSGTVSGDGATLLPLDDWKGFGYVELPSLQDRPVRIRTA